MIILDSSTSTKFSEHVIVHFHEKYFFSSNVSMKPFILMLEKNMISSNRGIVWNKDGTRQIPLFDVGVYTRLAYFFSPKFLEFTVYFFFSFSHVFHKFLLIDCSF